MNIDQIHKHHLIITVHSKYNIINGNDDQAICCKPRDLNSVLTALQDPGLQAAYTSHTKFYGRFRHHR